MLPKSLLYKLQNPTGFHQVEILTVNKQYARALEVCVTNVSCWKESNTNGRCQAGYGYWNYNPWALPFSGMHMTSSILSNSTLAPGMIEKLPA